MGQLCFTFPYKRLFVSPTSPILLRASTDAFCGIHMLSEPPVQPTHPTTHSNHSGKLCIPHTQSTATGTDAAHRWDGDSAATQATAHFSGGKPMQFLPQVSRIGSFCHLHKAQGTKHRHTPMAGCLMEGTGIWVWSMVTSWRIESEEPGSLGRQTIRTTSSPAVCL